MIAGMRLNSLPSIPLKTMQLNRSLRLSLFAVLLATTAPAADRTGNVTFGLTTTQEASGVSKAILTRLETEFPELDLSYSVAGTSQQLRSLEDGLIPFAITHNSDKESALVERGGHLRIEVFANDFLLVGPAGHTLECAETEIRQCLASIARSDMAFLSRGDQSGTNIYELSHWDALGIDPAILPHYTVGSGGAASSLRICAVRECFLIVDASSFARFDSDDLVEVARDEGANIYSLIYSSEFAKSIQGGFIEWLAAELPVIGEQFGYSAK